MPLIILNQLKSVPRSVLRGDKFVTEASSAFIGATTDKLSQFGVGLLCDDGQTEMWGLLYPHYLIRSWRAMHILDRVSYVEPGSLVNPKTLCACYYAAGRPNKNDTERERYVSQLRQQIPDIDDLCEQLFLTKIDDEELDSMLAFCNDPENGIRLAERELVEELEVGTINRTDEVSKTLVLAEYEHKLRKKNQKISKRQLPKDKSFKIFCKNAVIQYLSDTPIEAYGWWDWGHCDIEKIDEEIVYSGLNFGGKKYISCTQNPETAKNPGQFGRPVLRLKDGREFALIAAYYKSANMWISVKNVRDALSEIEEWRLSDFAKFSPKMIGITRYKMGDTSTEDIDRGYVPVKRTSWEKGIFAQLFKL